MAGQIKRLLEQIIRKRSGGDRVIMVTTKTKLVLKGIDPDKYSSTSEDDPAMIAKVRQTAAELGVSLQET